MNLEKKLADIRRLLDKEEFDCAAIKAAIVIENLLRYILQHHGLGDELQNKINQAAKQTNRRSIEICTLGELVGIIQKVKFMTMWQQAHSQSSSLELVNLFGIGKLNQFRNPLIHHDDPATQEEAEFLYSTLKLLIQHFGEVVREIGNPFGKLGRIDNDLHFFKRDLLQPILVELKKGQSVELLADPQMGKSSILYHIYRHCSNYLNKPAIYIDFVQIRDEQDFFKALCDELNLPFCYGRGLGKQLSGQKYILCLDKIERLTTDKFPVEMRNELRGISEGENTPFTLLISTSKPLKAIFPDTGIENSPLAGICKIIRVEPFSEKEVTGLIQQYLTGQPISFSETEIKTIFEQSQGHPHNIQELAYALYEKKAAALRG